MGYVSTNTNAYLHSAQRKMPRYLLIILCLGALLLAGEAVQARSFVEEGDQPWLNLRDDSLFKKVFSAYHIGTGFEIFIFKYNPAIRVIEFATLEAQASSLNRIAVLVETKGGPRDAIISEFELAERIRKYGRKNETFLLGHDYPISEVARFFTLARKNHVPLNPHEQELLGALLNLGWLVNDVTSGSLVGDREAALVSVAAPHRQGDKTDFSEEDYFLTLRHELSHGEFFTNPNYHNYTMTAWAALPAAVRDVFLSEFDGMGYDVSNVELMANEFQAYLWDPSAAGLIDIYLMKIGSGLAQLRSEFLTGLRAFNWGKSSLFSVPSMLYVRPRFALSG